MDFVNFVLGYLVYVWVGLVVSLFVFDQLFGYLVVLILRLWVFIWMI